ncbi:MAG: biotin carboxyl carrier domain-containing protein [Planctomycetota bacterium]|nr:MAG: biotin carboxyl carrier domain-containing protein [Planctomycetota bacterium]
MGTGVEGLCQCAAQAGRFYRRPEPQAPTYVQEGDEVQAGRTIGLIEVMKTFTPIRYEPGNHLPNPARIVRFFVDDGGDVEEGQALVEVQPLEAERGT